MAPISISHLTPHPKPGSHFPAPDSAEHAPFADELAKEAQALLDHADWPAGKEWHDGLVTTATLPSSAVELASPPPTSEAAEEVGGEDPSLVAPKGHGKKLFGGSKDSDVERTSSTEGLSFHQRTTILNPDEAGPAQGANYDKLWDALAVNHIAQEAEYVDNMSKFIQLPESEGFVGQSPHRLVRIHSPRPAPD